jgi:thiamine pyrophosphokinase
VTPERKVLGVLAGRDMPPERLADWARSSDLVLAADSGADALLAVGIVPQLVVGDLDSISLEAQIEQREILHDPDQDTSDCDKLLALAAGMGCHSITLCGAEGDLPDHVLGTLHSAARAPLDVRLAYRRGIGRVLRGPFAGSFAARVGARVSLLPLVPCGEVTLRGLEWELEAATLDPLGLTSLSNRATEERIGVGLASGAALLFIGTDGEPVWE